MPNRPSMWSNEVHIYLRYFVHTVTYTGFTSLIVQLASFDQNKCWALISGDISNDQLSKHNPAQVMLDCICKAQRAGMHGQWTSGTNRDDDNDDDRP